MAISDSFRSGRLRLSVYVSFGLLGVCLDYWLPRAGRQAGSQRVRKSLAVVVIQNP